MAALTLSQAKTALRARLDEASPTGSAWTNANLVEWINEGMRDLARRTEILHTMGTVPVINGSQNIPLNSLPGIAKIERVEWDPVSSQSIYPLEYRDFHNMDEVWWTSQAITRGRPHSYTTKGYPPALTIILYPIANESGDLRVYYDTVPARLTDITDDSTPLSVPDMWDDLILDYAEMRAFRTDNDPRWTSAMQMYEANVERMIERTRRWTQSTGMIQSSSGTMIPEWLWAG
jgi:hypothetical protein